MRTTFLGIALCTALIAGGCNKASETASTTTTTTATAAPGAATPAGSSVIATGSGATMTPEQLGQLAALINKQPANADKLLADQGMTQATFETAIRQVSSDPSASKRYAASYKSAS
jgi:hypothetical protein